MITPTELLRDFITLFVVIDPIGTLPVYLFATRGLPAQMHRQVAIRAVFVATAVLVSFMIFGQLVLEGLGLRLGAFQVAGGLVLFLFALTMIFGEAKPEADIHAVQPEAGKPLLGSRAELARSRAVYPLAMPSIASPGAMLAIVVLTNNDRHSLAEQAVIGCMLLVVLALTLGLLLVAARAQRLIGATGASVVSRVMGMILASVAVDAVLGGLESLGVLYVPGQGALG